MIKLDFGNPVIWLGVSRSRSYPDRFAINWIYHDRYGAITLTFPLNVEFAIHNNSCVYSVFCITYLKPLAIEWRTNFDVVAWMRYGLLEVGDIHDLWCDYLPPKDPGLPDADHEDCPADYYIDYDGEYYYNGD